MVGFAKLTRSVTVEVRVASQLVVRWVEIYEITLLGVPLILLPKVPVGFVGNYSVSVWIS